MKQVIRSITFLFVLSAEVGQAGQYNTVINIGDQLPDFKTLPATDGSFLSASDLKADVVVLVSLANHCPWVRGMDQGLIDLVNQFKNQSVKVIGFAVNHREDDRLEAMKVHAKKAGYNFTYVFDESQQLGRDLGATRTPEYFVFNQDRQLIYMGLLHNSPAKMNKDGGIRQINGEPNEFYAATAITEHLAGKPVSTAETRAHGCSVKYK